MYLKLRVNFIGSMSVEPRQVGINLKNYKKRSS